MSKIIDLHEFAKKQKSKNQEYTANKMPIGDFITAFFKLHQGEFKNFKRISIILDDDNGLESVGLALCNTFDMDEYKQMLQIALDSVYEVDESPE